MVALWAEWLSQFVWRYPSQLRRRSAPAQQVLMMVLAAVRTHPMLYLMVASNAEVPALPTDAAPADSPVAPGRGFSRAEVPAAHPTLPPSEGATGEGSGTAIRPAASAVRWLHSGPSTGGPTAPSEGVH